MPYTQVKDSLKIYPVLL